MFDWVENRRLPKSLKYWAYSCSEPKNEGEKICVTCFWKTKGRDGTVKRTSVYAEAAVWRIL